MVSKLNLLFFFISTIIIVFTCQSFSTPIENNSNVTNGVVNEDNSFNRSDCLLPPLDGDGVKHCLAYFVKYYFDNATKTCQTFIYGGCGGNANRFSSEQECLDACL